MSTFPELHQNENQTQCQLRRRIDKSHCQVHNHAEKATRWQKIAQESQQILEQFQKNNPQLENRTTNNIENWLFLFALLAVFLIDYVILTPITEFLVTRNFSSSHILVTIAPLIIPLAIIILELMISNFRFYAHEDAQDGFGRWSTFWLWTALGILLGLAIPAAVVATNLASGLIFSTWIRATLIFTLIALSLAGHMLVIFGGRQILIASSTIFNKIRYSKIKRRGEKANRSSKQESRITTNIFRNYIRDLNTYNNIHGVKLEALPFDKDVQEVLQHTLGYNPIQDTMTQNSQQNRSSSDSPSASDESQSSSGQTKNMSEDEICSEGNGTVDELLSNAPTNSQREAEREVRP